VRQENQTQGDQRYAPRDGIAIQLTANCIFFSVRRHAGSHELRRTASVDGCEQPGTDNSKHKEGHAISDDCHLEKAGENRKVDNSFGRLAVVRGAQSGDKK
jgi:hypothetical protein